jgi:DNA-binding MarR family transcriptional regulator
VNRIEDCISFVIGKAAKQIGRRARELLEPLGVTPTQYAVLKALADANGETGAEVGARLEIDSATTTGVVDRLAAAGLVERRADPTDRRLQRLFLTNRALGLLPEADLAMDRLNEDVVAELGGEAERLWANLRVLHARKS